MRELDDPDASFASRVHVRLEVLPKPLHFDRRQEAEFYQEFFSRVSRRAEPGPDLAPAAFDEGRRSGLPALDALHVAAASILEADESITAEDMTEPIHRIRAVSVRSIRSATTPLSG